MMMPKWLWLLVVLPWLVTACAQDVAVPENTYQSASDLLSRSLSTVDPEESLPLFEYDRDAPLDIQEVKQWRQEGVSFVDLTYESPKGGRVPATLMIPDGRGPFAGMVFMHGSGGARKDYYWLGAKYAHLGALSIAIDAPYIRPDHYIKTPYMSGSWPRWNEVDRDEQIQLVIDLQRAVDLLVARRDVDPDRIAYLGYSYGGAMGGLFAGIERRLQAYVLMVGDGGLVEHLSDPDEKGYPYHWSERWVAAMWPIEPLHFVGRAAPAALLYQNGIQDQNVPMRDSVRYQLAGSRPKDIKWYDSDHALPARAFQDGASWLQGYIGPNLLILSPNFRSSARVLDRLLAAWWLLTLGSIGFTAWDLVWGTKAPWRVKLIWLLVSAFLGPLGLLAYLVSQRQFNSFRGSQANLNPFKRALGSAACSLVGILTGFILALGIVIVFEPLEAPLEFGLVYGLSILFGVMVVLWLHLAPRLNSQNQISFPGSLLVGIVSANAVLAGAFPVAVFGLNRWIPFDFNPASPLVWTVFSLAAIAGILTGYPIHLWMANRNLVKWGVISMPAAYPEPQSLGIRKLGWLEIAGMILTSFVVLSAANKLLMIILERP
jgi:predicted esterase